MKQRIRLRGINGDTKGQSWESESVLRAGRLGSLEIVLDDSSVSRRHAELRITDQGWWVRDLGSTNGTFLNGVRLGPGERALRPRDIIQFGKVAMVVELPENGAQALEATVAPEQILVEASTSNSWEDGIQSLVYDRNRCLRPGDQLLAMLRAGHHLVNLESEEELLHSILNDAVGVLDAQRGAIVLAEGPNNILQLRALATGRGDPPGRFSFSQKVAQRSFSRGESVLCCSVSDDPELATAQSIADGAMASVLCVLLRTPRRRLGVLHLDRSYWQKPFSEDDLHLADALAANVSAGIECAMLLRKERELFLNTVTIMAQALELRDPYTGGHTARVTSYSMMLAKQIELPTKDLNLIRIGTPLHDIGKIGIDDAILRKPGRLTAEEFAIMKTHTVKGADIVGKLPDLASIIPIVRSHHERWDGRGYPDGLTGEDTPLLARIVAVADAFDAITSDRPYHENKRGKPPEVAFSEVEKQSGQQFDPKCAAAFLEIRDRVVEEMESHHEANPIIPPEIV